MIEFDDNGLEGTRGSGTMLAQQPTAFSAGLKGSYAFGLSGDTPCLPACTVGIIAGPVASVGQFTTDGTSLLTSGTSDANIATKNYADALLTGSYGAADGNGRLQLTMDTAGTPSGIYPTDYAVYLVNANQAFLMSTDKHSTYLLLAGTAQLQTQSYLQQRVDERSLHRLRERPGISRTVGCDLGRCAQPQHSHYLPGYRQMLQEHATLPMWMWQALPVWSIGLTGLGSSATILNALLGTYQSTGTSTCTVAANGRGVLDYPTPNNALSLDAGRCSGCRQLRRLRVSSIS